MLFGPGLVKKSAELAVLAVSAESPPHRAPSNYAYRKYDTEPGKDVTVGGVESDVAAEAELGGQRVDGVAGNALADAAEGIDNRGDAVVGVAQQPAPVLDGAHAGHVQVLPGRAGVAIPAVVAQVHKDVGAELGELPHLVGKDRLIADEHSVAMGIAVRAPEQENPARLAWREPRDFAGELVREEEQLRERHVLAEGNEVHFVVAAD